MEECAGHVESETAETVEEFKLLAEIAADTGALSSFAGAIFQCASTEDSKFATTAEICAAIVTANNISWANEFHDQLRKQADVAVSKIKKSLMNECPHNKEGTDCDAQLTAKEVAQTCSFIAYLCSLGIIEPFGVLELGRACLSQPSVTSLRLLLCLFKTANERLDLVKFRMRTNELCGKIQALLQQLTLAPAAQPDPVYQELRDFLDLRRKRTANFTNALTP